MRKIIIIGKGDSWKLAPEGGETWGVNDLCFRREVTLIFQMHEWDASDLTRDILAYSKRKNIPVISLTNFPLDKMHTDYFTNSISYMIAYAIFVGATHIDMYGCVMATKDEYAFQKPNIEYWIGYASGKGIKVTVFGNTNLLKSEDGKVYGYNINQTGTSPKI